jgi:hypothetical protein
MIIHSQPVDPAIHKTACVVARRCRFIIQAVLFEAEWADAEFEFYLVVREELEKLLAAHTSAGSTKHLETPHGQ